MPTTATINSTAVRLPPSRPALAGATPMKLATKVLHVPLAVKLIGANIATVLVAVVAAFYAHNNDPGDSSFTGILAAALVLGTVVNVALTYTALRPIRDIEGTIKRMWRGDTQSRVTASAVGDPELDRIGFTVNSLLDQLERDRDAMRQLAADVVIAEDREQRRISVQLHESVAQSLASITYMLTALAAKSEVASVAERILEIRRVVGDVLDEVDVLAHDIHPRVLNDLGLSSGLRALAFDVSKPEMPVSVRLSGCRDEDLRDLGPETASALYRIAQEAVQNALRHSSGSMVEIVVAVEGPNLVLRVRDNGKGFVVDDVEQRRPRKGLFLMEQRAVLINAKLNIASSPHGGTCVAVTMPLGSTSLTA